MNEARFPEAKGFAKFLQPVMHVAFGPFVLDSDSRQVLRGESPLHLSPKGFDLLLLLLERRPAVVTKTEVHARIWPGTFVEDANLSVLVADLRRALEDDPKRPAYIRTVHGRGYAFCGSAEDRSPPTVAAAEPVARCWLAWREHTRPLAAGENILGRDPGCEIWIDARGVSRRHAKLFVAPERVILEDLSSTNGTFIGDRRLTAPHTLADGDTIHLGPEMLTFRAWSEAGPPPTERVRRRK
jgi:DNA-binding winged helix-turn-helix (wHTH) protein